MKHEIKDGDRLISTIETHGQAVVVVHEPEINKPVQFADDRDTYVECSPEQRAEIIRVAKEYGRDIYDVSEDVKFSYKNLAWNTDDDGPYLYETGRTKLEDAGCLWLPFDEFVARLKGEWVEPTEEPKTNLLYPEGLEAVVKDGEIPKSIWCNYNGTKYEYRPQRDYSHLIGKWVMRIGFSNACYTQWKWYKVVSDDNPVTGISILDCDGDAIHSKDSDNDYTAFVAQFDLTDIRDENPDDVERIIPFDIERWRKGEFGIIRTRDGRDVEQLTEYDCILTPLVGIIKGEAGVSCWDENGNYGNLSEQHSHDIILVVKGEGGKP
jgi:hypothetical protein